MLKSKLNETLIRAHITKNNMRDSLKREMKRKRKGAFAFEYIIVLVLMVAVIFAAWNVLTPVIQKKVQDIANTVSNNGV